jgi:hypothetical protein
VAFAFIEDNLGKIMVAVGVFLLVGAVFWLSALLGSFLSAASLFFGILFVFFGLSLQLGFFSGDQRNLGGVGTALISISVVCFAFSLAAAQFSEITKVLTVAEVFHGGLLGWWYTPITRPSYLWFTGIMIYSSLIAFVSGIALKVFHAIK